MVLFAGIAGLISLLVGGLVTARLFSLARRTRRIPEQLLAIAFGGLFCVGYPLAGASRAPGLNATNEGALLFAIGTIGMIVGTVALGSFPRVVFRPGKRWASLLSTAIALTGSVGGVGSAVSVARAETSLEMIELIQPWAVTLMATLCVCFIWNGVESILYYRSMKRRVALGLAQPETTHRFLLWAIASVCSVAAVGTITVMRASGMPIVSALPMAIIACCALTSASCWWLAFFMPDAYRRRVFDTASRASTKPD